MKRYVAGFYRGANGHPVLVMKTKPEWQKGKLNAPGGHVEEHEVPIDAMVREFAEETGVRVRRARWENFAVLRGVRDGEEFVVWWFRANYEVGDATPDTPMGSTETVYTSPLRDGGKSLLPNLGWLLAMSDPCCSHDWPYAVWEQTEESK